MNKSTNLITKPGAGPAWNSGTTWRLPRLEPSARDPGWNLACAKHNTVLRSLFLPLTRDRLEALPKERVLVRDGLAPLLHFFCRFPQPPGKFASRFLLHEDWRAFVPRPWRKHCGLYRIAHLPDPSLFEPVPPARRRAQAFFAFHFTPDYCSVEHLESLVQRLARVPLLRKAFERKTVLALLEPGAATQEYQLQAHFLLHSLLGRPPKLVSYGELKHFLDLRGFFVLDLNERLQCSDDANLHLSLSRGAIDPLARPQGGRKGEFIRLSPFHGYWLTPFPNEREGFWECRETKALRAFLGAASGPARRNHAKLTALRTDWIPRFLGMRNRFPPGR